MEWRAHIARHGGRCIPGEAWTRWTLLALLLLAATLRLWRLADIPYTHDEISGLLRTGYASFGELIHSGVAIDAHPPATAVLLHYWTMLFGYSEGWVKAPFIMLSIAALFMLYRFTMAWTNHTVALFTLALLATLQYTVMYAQIARPYALGFFTCALLADQWTRWLAGGPQARRALLGMVLGFVLCAYTHHFALLLAGLVGLTGLFLASAGQRRTYLLACTGAVLLYLPNVPIFLQQLSYGGVGQWLAAPDRFWVPDHLYWIVQYHWPLGLSLLALITTSLAARVRHGNGRGPILWAVLLWGVAPLLIGLAYSLLVDPVLQYSVLLFSFPFLLLALLHGLPMMRQRDTLLIAGMLVIMGLDGLVRVRQHYTAFYGSKYEAILRNGSDALVEHGEDGTLVLVDAPDEVIAFYLRRMGIPGSEFPHVNLRSTPHTAAQLDSLLLSARGRIVAYGEANGAEPEQVARIQLRFPFLVLRKDLVEGQVYRFSDSHTDVPINDRRPLLEASPRSLPAHGVSVPQDMPVDSTGAWSYDEREYGVMLTVRVDSLVSHPQDRIEVRAELAPGMDTWNVGLVLELKLGDSTMFYRSDELERASREGGQATLLVTAKAGDARWRGEPLELRAYLHNRHRTPLRLLRMDLAVRAGNHWQYGLFRPIPPAPLFP